MFAASIPEGALFYGANRRRKAVAFGGDLRDLTLRVLDEARACLDAARLPRATYDQKRCDACSLIGECQPRAKGPRAAVQRWVARRIESDGVPE